MLTRAQILEASAASATKVLKISTPAWGGSGHVYVRMLPGSELKTAMTLLGEDEDEALMMAKLCVLLVSDANGKRVLNAGDVLAILDGPLGPMVRCVNAALELNGLTDTAQDAIVKNSPSTRSKGRGTGTRVRSGAASRKRKTRRTRAR